MLINKLILFFLLISVNCFSQIGLYTAPCNKLIGFDTDLYLPDTIYVAQGNSVKIYNDNVAYIPASKHGRCTFTWVTLIGNVIGDYLNVNTTGTGNYLTKIYAVNSMGVYCDSASTIIKVEPKIALGNKTILPIGNSLTALGWQYCRPVIDDSLNVTLTSIGLIGSDPNKNEGHSGWTTATFLGATSPFYIGGVINVPQYLINNSLATPDIIRISLGINEGFSLTNPTSTINNLKTLVTKCLAVTGVKVIVVMPSTASNTIYGWMTNYSNTKNYEAYVLNIRQLQQLIHTNFAHGAYNANVDVASDYLYIDRNNNYPKTGGYHNNALHPSAAGYRQLINGTLNDINHIFK